MSDLSSAVQKHYSTRPLVPLIREKLRSKGIEDAQVGPADLYPYDQSHAGGVAATRMLAQRAAIAPGSVVVDIGCGFGSASRLLRAERQCRVVGVDLTPARIATAIELTRMVGFHSGVDFAVGSALSLPLGSAIGDVVWTQHVTMNLPEHGPFVSECARVLKPSGRLASHEWLRRGAGEPPYPLPWAYTPPLNHAIDQTRFLRLLEGNDFEPEVWEVTEEMREALTGEAARLEQQNHPPERTAAMRNLVRAAGEGLFGCFMIVAGRR